MSKDIPPKIKKIKEKIIFTQDGIENVFKIYLAFRVSN